MVLPLRWTIDILGIDAEVYMVCGGGVHVNPISLRYDFAKLLILSITTTART